MKSRLGLKRPPPQVGLEPGTAKSVARAYPTELLELRSTTDIRQDTWAWLFKTKDIVS